MAKVKLNLGRLSELELLELAQDHKEAMTGNANFPTPEPDMAAFQGMRDAAEGARQTVRDLETQLASARSLKDQKLEALRKGLTQRGNYVQTASAGDAAKIESAAFEIQSERTPTSSLERPANLVATVGDDAGEVDLSWNAVPRARFYVVQYRPHEQPDAWVQAAIATSSKTAVTALGSGKKFAFRVQAHGPRDVTSAWSDEAVSNAG